MINVCIIGSTGYVGIETVRILQYHPKINVSSVVSQNFVGQKISDVYPNLNSIFDMELEPIDIDKISKKSDIFITALPHSISKAVIPELVEKGKRIIDFSGDFRYKSINLYEKWYNSKHEMPYLLQSSVYGLPELYRKKIKNSTIVGNPGCHPTSIIISLAPVLKNNIIHPENIVISAATGITCLGKNTESSYHFSECTENFKSYKIVTHKHTAEIEEKLSIIANKEITVSFLPHLTPMKRGMLCTIHANLLCTYSENDLLDLFKEFYKNEYFVRILDNKKLPETKWVSGSNFIDIGLIVDKRLNKVIILCALDNLLKGSSGQAVQNLNIMCNFPENMGLEFTGSYL